MNKTLNSIFLAAALFSSVANADVYEEGTITRLIIEGSNKVSIWLSGTNDTSECSGGARWMVTTEDPLFQEKLSILLTAASTNKVVKLRHLSSGGCNTWNASKIYLVDVNY